MRFNEPTARSRRSLRAQPYGDIIKERGILEPLVIIRGAEIVGEKFFTATTKITGVKLTKEERERGGIILGEAALFAGAAPFFQTTAQLTKTLGKTTDVLITGVTQKGAGKAIQTDIKFLTSEGKTGVARGLSVSRQSADDLVQSLTIGAGKVSTKRIVRLPDAKIITKFKKFGGIEESVSKGIGDTFFKQYSKGFTFSKQLPTGKFIEFPTGKLKFNLKLLTKQITRFESGTLGGSGGQVTKGVVDIGGKPFKVLTQMPDDITTFIGGLRGEGGLAKFGGLLKDAKGVDKIFTIGTKTKTGLISPPAFQSLASITTQAVQPTITPVILSPALAFAPLQKLVTLPQIKDLTPSVSVRQPSITGAVVKTKQRTIPSQKFVERLTPKFDSKAILSTAQPQPQRSRERQKLQTKQQTKQLSRQKVLQQTRQRLKQRQKLALKMPQLLQQEQVSRFLGFPKFQFFPKPKRLVPFALPRLRGKTKKKDQQIFTTFVRKRGRFIPILKTADFQKAFAGGKSHVEQSLRATFKIEGLGKQLVPTPKGFRRKGQLFIQRRSKRLSARKEVSDIQLAKRRKAKPRKRKGGKK